MDRPVWKILEGVNSSIKYTFYQTFYNTVTFRLPGHWRIHYLKEEIEKYRINYIAVWFTIMELLDSKEAPNLGLEKATKTNLFSHMKKGNREKGWEIIS